MYIVIVYDIGEKRVAKVCKFLRKYLYWVQNSVFEGDLTESQFEKVKHGLKKLIKEDEDMVLYYVFSTPKWVERGILGKEKNPIDAFL
ncbi:CRISPR-associated endonuclease Cas2 [Carboxydocella sp. JDF658]|uniref:CRISPR-associated endonuclease Cas2 n=1 Tax=Carboxydocella sp. JDF658 TaxID=1926600 RepID=UPI0009AE0D98|nr:CRISPR-associated endonuclease Cas2 [Carboxydocella sp. JDF658]AVX29692.1 CRISPR-associated protein Cas2 [Carboxydocella thermautotrophica]